MKPLNQPRRPLWRLALPALLGGALLVFLPAIAAWASQARYQDSGYVRVADSGKSGKHQHHKHGNKKKYGKYQKTRVVYVFVPEHRERMRDYFVMHRNDLPRYYYEDYDDNLPYDVRRRLVVRQYFPRELEYRLHPFPSGLNSWLGPAPYGTRRVMFGRDAYLLQNRSNLILDIISNLAWRR